MKIIHSIRAEFKIKQYLIDHPEIKHLWTDQVILHGCNILPQTIGKDTLLLEPLDGSEIPGEIINDCSTWGKAHVRRFSKRFKKRTCCVCSHVIKLKEIFIERTEHNGGFEHYSHCFCFHHGLQHLMRQPVTYQYGGKTHDH